MNWQVSSSDFYSVLVDKNTEKLFKMEKKNHWIADTFFCRVLLSNLADLKLVLQPFWCLFLIVVMQCG